jgi:hypothetical protein
MKGSVLRLLLFVFGALVGLWLLDALVQGLLVGLSLTASRFFFFYWFQKFGLGVIVGFLLGVGASWLLFYRRTDDESASVEPGRAEHLAETDRQLEVLRKELSGSGDSA